MPPLRLCLHLMCLRWFVWHRWGSDATCALVLEYLAIDTSCFLLTEKTHVPTESYSSLLWPNRSCCSWKGSPNSQISTEQKMGTHSRKHSRQLSQETQAMHLGHGCPPCPATAIHTCSTQPTTNGKSHLSVLARRHLGCRGDPFGARGSIPRLMERSSSTLGFSAGLRPRQTLSKSQEGNPSVEVANPAPPRFRTRASTAK